MVSLPDSMLREMCQNFAVIRILFGVAAAFFALSLIWTVALPSGSGSYVISVVNLVGSGVLALATGVVLRLCRSEGYTR